MAIGVSSLNGELNKFSLEDIAHTNQFNVDKIKSKRT